MRMRCSVVMNAASIATATAHALIPHRLTFAKEGSLLAIAELFFPFPAALITGYHPNSNFSTFEMRVLVISNEASRHHHLIKFWTRLLSDDTSVRSASLFPLHPDWLVLVDLPP